MQEQHADASLRNGDHAAKGSSTNLPDGGHQKRYYLRLLMTIRFFHRVIDITHAAICHVGNFVEIENAAKPLNSAALFEVTEHRPTWRSVICSVLDIARKACVITQ